MKTPEVSPYGLTVPVVHVAEGANAPDFARGKLLKSLGIQTSTDVLPEIAKICGIGGETEPGKQCIKTL